MGGAAARGRPPWAWLVHGGVASGRACALRGSQLQGAASGGESGAERRGGLRWVHGGRACREPQGALSGGHRAGRERGDTLCRLASAVAQTDLRPTLLALAGAHPPEPRGSRALDPGAGACRAGPGPALRVSPGQHSLFSGPGRKLQCGHLPPATWHLGSLSPTPLPGSRPPQVPQGHRTRAQPLVLHGRWTDYQQQRPKVARNAPGPRPARDGVMLAAGHPHAAPQ